jgi:hypothetical protein
MIAEEFEVEFDSLIERAMVDARGDADLRASIVYALARDLGRCIALLTAGNDSALNSCLETATQHAFEEAAVTRKRLSEFAAQASR